MKLCLIGSTRFMPQYIEANRQLTLQGHIVYTVATISTSSAESKSDITEADKQILDLVHLRKIQESDGVVLVTDESGYVGFSTRRELQWAQMNGIRIYQRIKDVGTCIHELWDPRKESFNG
jgi:hypothetical protein